MKVDSRRLLRKVCLSYFIIAVIVSVCFNTAFAEEENKARWTNIAVGNTHSLGVKEDGSVWAWGGNNVDGQFGNGENGYDIVNTMVPVKVKDLTDVISVAAGQSHSMALKKNGTVWTWGNNQDGQLGDGTQTNYDHYRGKYIANHNKNTPIQVMGLTDVVMVAADWTRSFALTKDGSVWAWGGIYYKKPDGSIANITSPFKLPMFKDIKSISVGYGNMIALKNDGTVWAMSGREAEQIQGVTDIVEIAAGGEHSYGLKEDGSIWYWGSNGTGIVAGASVENEASPRQLDGINQVASIQATAGGPLMLRADGTVWTMGSNRGGQLGIGSYEDSDVPVQVHKLKNVKKIAGNGIGYRSMAIRADGTLWSWGFAYTGDGTEWYRTVPVWIRSYDSEVYHDDPIFVELNQRVLRLDQPPVIMDDRTMVPLRLIAEELGATVEWNQAISIVNVKLDDNTISITIADAVAIVNGKSVQMDVPAVIMNGSTLVPLRFISESFGIGVKWDEARKTVVLTSQ